MNSRRVWSVAGLSGTAALAAAAAGTVSWYYANRLTQPPADVAEPLPEPDDRVTVDEVGSDRITLSGPDAARPGHWGLRTDAGYALLRPDVAPVGATTASRGYTLRTGTLAAGADGLLDSQAWPNDGATMDPPAHEVEVPTPLGAAPAWFVPGRRRTWMIVVHGRRMQRNEGFRIASVAAAAGVPVLAISYRNDGEAPRSPDNRSHLGWTEWEDLDAAIAYARGHGASDVVLAGLSMGGALVVAAVRRGDHAAHVRGLVLEAPVLDWGPVVRRAALDRGLPATLVPALLPVTFAVARARHGIDWAGLRSDPAALAHPTLLIHGDADATVPVELSDTLHDARPDVVRYLRVRGAGHVQAWNTARPAFERAVTDHLRALGALAAP